MTVCAKLPLCGCEGHIFVTPLADFRNVKRDKTSSCSFGFCFIRIARFYGALSR